MNVLVVYRTRYGSTREYAQWIGEELHADVRPMDTVRSSDIAPYDTIIVGGYLRMGKIQGVDFLTRYWSDLSGKRLFLFSVAGAPERSPERALWFGNSLPEHIREHVQHFPLRGRAKNLNWWDRFLISFPKILLRRAYKKDPSEANKRALAGMDEFDAVSRPSIAQLVNAVRAQ